MFKMEQSSCPLSHKLRLMDSIAKLIKDQDNIVKPGKFVPNPPKIEAIGIQWQEIILKRDLSSTGLCKHSNTRL